MVDYSVFINSVIIRVESKLRKIKINKIWSYIVVALGRQASHTVAGGWGPLHLKGQTRRQLINQNE